MRRTSTKRVTAWMMAAFTAAGVSAAPPAGPAGLRFRGPGSVIVSVTPSPVAAAAGGQVQFSALVQNASNPAVTWSVVEGAGCGSVTGGGLYTAPGAPATCHVRAVSQQSPGSHGTAVVSVRTTVPGGPTGAVGVWENISASIPGMAAGDWIQSVVDDPANPGHFYTATGNNDGRRIKWYRTTNFGDTWELRNNTAMGGNPWGFSIDPNPNRNPAALPTLFSPAGYGDDGAWKSTDGAATWTRLPGADAAFGPYNPYGLHLTDLYHLAVLPDDPPNHILATYHYGMGSYDGVNRCKDANGFNSVCPDGGFGESWDGGATWVVHPPAPGMGTSHYVIPVSATTWCVIAQDQSGIWRTTTAGRVGGTAGAKYRDGAISTAAWEKVSSFEHAHGSFSSWRSPAGAWYIAAYQVIGKSTDEGATWQAVAGPNWPGTYFGVRSTNIVGTGTHLYSNFFVDPVLARAPLSDDAAWEASFDPPPAPQVGGAPLGTASAYAPSIGKYVILMGSYEGEMWRYIEP